MEEVEIGETPNDNIKEIELILENIKYKCEIQKMEKDDHVDYLDISVYNNKIRYKGLIHIYNIEYQLGVLNYNIDNLFKNSKCCLILFFTIIILFLLAFWYY